MVFRVTGAYEDKTRVEIELPYDKNGEPAFDHAGKPIRGMHPVVLVLPRWNYMSLDQIKALMRAAEEVEKRETGDQYEMLDRQRESILISLRQVVDDDEYALLEQLTLGELGQINTEWSTKSNESLTLGESSASVGSSMSTQRR